MGYAALWTLTAPSSARHREFLPGRPGRHGWCDTCPQGISLAEWNAQAGRFWDRGNRALRHAGYRHAYFRAVEVQAGEHCSDGCAGRGALHLHVYLFTDTPLDVEELHRIARRAGFGCVMDVKVLAGRDARVARYVAKYVTKAADDRQDVPWSKTVVDASGASIEQRRPTYRTWSTSRNWGLTMREVDAGLRAAWEAAAARRDADLAGDPAWTAPVGRLGLPAPPGRDGFASV